MDISRKSFIIGIAASMAAIGGGAAIVNHCRVPKICIIYSNGESKEYSFDRSEEITRAFAIKDCRKQYQALCMAYMKNDKYKYMMWDAGDYLKANHGVVPVKYYMMDENGNCVFNPYPR